MTIRHDAIHPLGQDHLLAAADICAEAMNDNPIHIQIFSASPELRQRRLRRFFTGLLAFVLRKGGLYGAFSDGILIGVLGMLPPKNCKPSPRDLLQLTPTLLACNSLVGLFRMAIWLGTWARIDPSTPHWHIGPLAVAASWQRRGIGTQLMQYACRQGSGHSLYLETDKLTNVTFYERFGFSVLATPSILATPSWTMMRPH